MCTLTKVHLSRAGVKPLSAGIYRTVQFALGTFSDYTALLWHLAIESRPELQAHPALTADHLREPSRYDGQPIDIEESLTNNSGNWTCCWRIFISPSFL